jgi:hypothetical protein
VTSVQKLSWIILICREAEQLAEFYIRAFGFVLIEDSPKSDPGFAELIGFADGQVRLTSLRFRWLRRSHQDEAIRGTFLDGIRGFSISPLWCLI